MSIRLTAFLITTNICDPLDKITSNKNVITRRFLQISFNKPYHPNIYFFILQQNCKYLNEFFDMGKQNKNVMLNSITQKIRKKKLICNNNSKKKKLFDINVLNVLNNSLQTQFLLKNLKT